MVFLPTTIKISYKVRNLLKKLDKIDRIEVPAEEESISFQFPTPPRGGDDVVIIKDLAKSWPLSEGAQHDVFDGLSVTVKRTNKRIISFRREYGSINKNS